jgi:FtsZ-binding cell division protein ZapB
MENQSSNRKTTIILTIIVVILAVGLGLLYMQYNKMKADNSIVQEALEEQKESLTNELKDMMSEYEGLKTDNDSLNNLIDKQQGRIKHLLAINADNLEKIKIYKRELTTLRQIMQSYIVQIDSLNQRNQKLIAENSEVRTALDEARKNNESLSKEKESMNSKLQTASVLSAKNIIVTLLNQRGKETEKASRVAKIKTCFTIRENSLIDAGEKIIYLRLTRPDNLVLASSEKDVIDYEGKQIAFSAKRAIQYEQKDIDACIYWDNAGELIPGTYTVDLFAEGKLIGTTTFQIK